MPVGIQLCLRLFRHLESREQSTFPNVHVCEESATMESRENFSPEVLIRLLTRTLLAGDYSDTKPRTRFFTTSWHSVRSVLRDRATLRRSLTIRSVTMGNQWVGRGWWGGGGNRRNRASFDPFHWLPTASDGSWDWVSERIGAFNLAFASDSQCAEARSAWGHHPGHLILESRL